MHTFYARVQMRMKGMLDYTERKSNAELLRILCILAILLHHFCIHALYPEIVPLDIIGKGWDSHFILSIYGFIYIGVNCFILISGWFKIKLSWRGFINLYLICAIYNLLASYQHFLSWDTLREVFLPFLYGDLWFIKAYFKLFFLAPFLNPAIVHMNKWYYVLLLIIIEVAGMFYTDIWYFGYSLPHFIFLYLLGGFLRRVVTEEKAQAYRWYYLGAYMLFGAIWGICTMLTAYGHTIKHWDVWNYNNPILLLTAVSFFLFMMSWDTQNMLINRLAMSTLAVYILNDAVVGYDFLKPYAHAFTPGLQLMFWIGVTIVFYVGAVIIDQIRILITQPIISKFS